MNLSNPILVHWTSPPDGRRARNGGEYPRWNIKGSRLACVSSEEKRCARIVYIGSTRSIAVDFAGDYLARFIRKAAITRSFRDVLPCDTAASH